MPGAQNRGFFEELRAHPTEANDPAAAVVTTKDSRVRETGGGAQRSANRNRRVSESKRAQRRASARHSYGRKAGEM